MYRNKKIIILSHCILNQNSVVRPLARAKGCYTEVVHRLLANNIGIIQLPCPELLFLGESRPPMTRDQYNTYEYRTFCNALSQNVLIQIKEYLKHHYKIVGIVGIQESPTCSLVKNQGIFMEILLSLLEKNGINLFTFEIPMDYVEGQDNQSFLRDFEAFISQ